MGSRLGTLSDAPHSRSSAVASSGESGTVSLANGGGILLDSSSNRRHHSHSRRAASNTAGQPGSLSVVGPRQRASSASDATSQPAGSSEGAGLGSSTSNNVADSSQSRSAAPQHQYSLFGHYWDAFLNSDSSSDDDEVEDSENDDDSSSGSEHRHRGEISASRHHHYNRRRQHRRTNQDLTPFFTSASSSSTAGSSLATNSALPIRIPATTVSTSNALSRASNRRRLRALIAAHSLPFPLFSVSDFKCPICHKTVPSEDIELHVVVCLTKPRIDYNVDVLAEDKGECIICFEEMCSGDTIARLPCLCIYHKRCIDQWFGVRRACPAHPPDDD